MNKWVRRLLISFLVLSVLIVLLVNIGARFMRYSDQEVQEMFNGSTTTIDLVYHEYNDYKVRLLVEEESPNDSVLLVFIHGAPGSCDAFKDYLKDADLAQNSRLITYDRPGYGNSSSTPMTDIEEQVDVLLSIIDKYRLPRVIVVGHSYGGPIAGVAAIKDTSNIDHAVLIAALIDPVSEPIFWYSYFSYWKMTRWLLPVEFQVAGSEKFNHAKTLEKVVGKWSQIDAQVTFIHGMTDGLAPPQENIDFAKNHIPANRLNLKIYKDKGHLILWQDYDLIKGILMEIIKN